MKPLEALPKRPAKAVLAVIVGAVIIIGGYTLLAAFPFLQGPSLTLEPIQFSDGVHTVRGQTNRVSYLKINDLPVALREDGSFEVERAFPPGYTAVTVLATDRFGRTLTKALTFVTPSYGEN